MLVPSVGVEPTNLRVISTALYQLSYEDVLLAAGVSWKFGEGL